MTETLATTPPRLLVVQAPEQWTGAINHQDFFQIPSSMDVLKEETAWFASGGDSSGVTFCDYLIAQGAQKIDVEVWSINM